ncbi:MAG: hypothetical protein IKE24_05980 [Clostridia bacterium]|nr:hypothetical protein [Clostridia bacterium]
MEIRLAGISRPEALRYLGMRGPVPPDVDGDLDRCEAILRRSVCPRGAWRCFDLCPDGTLSGTAFRPEGQSVRELLRGCSRAVLMAATLGAEADLLIRRAQGKSLLDAALLDALCNAAIEDVCDALCADLAREFAPAFLTPRFSPGYGDFPLSQQPLFAAALDLPRRLGITLTDSFLMTPQKSVTALIGVSDRAPAPKQGGGCAACSFSDRCLYRKGGATCGR